MTPKIHVLWFVLSALTMVFSTTLPLWWEILTAMTAGLASLALWIKRVIRNVKRAQWALSCECCQLHDCSTINETRWAGR